MNEIVDYMIANKEMVVAVIAVLCLAMFLARSVERILGLVVSVVAVGLILQAVGVPMEPALEGIKNGIPRVKEMWLWISEKMPVFLSAIQVLWE